MEQDPKSIIDEMIDNMTIEELKAAARIGLGVTLAMMNKTIDAINKHILQKREKT